LPGSPQYPESAKSIQIDIESTIPAEKAARSPPLATEEAFNWTVAGYLGRPVRSISPARNPMSSIGSVPPNVSKILQVASEKAQTENQIAVAVAGKQLQATKQTGEAVLQMLESAVDISAQLSQGRLDVRG
jgi:hypothetical protein